MELRLPLEVSPGREATCRAVFGTWGSFPDDARASHCPFVLTSFTGWSSERCPGIGFFSRGDREIGVLRNVEAPTRPRLKCRREPGLILRCDRKVGNPFQTKQGSRPSCRDQEGRRGSEEVVAAQLDALAVHGTVKQRLVEFAADDHFTRDSRLNEICRRIWGGPPESGGL